MITITASITNSTTYKDPLIVGKMKTLFDKEQLKESLFLSFDMPLPETVYIYYGSEMGTGQGFAEDLGAFLEKNGIHNTVLDIDEFEDDDIVNQELCIFFFSTYGKGMPTRRGGLDPITARFIESLLRLDEESLWR